MGRGISGGKKNHFRASVVAGIVILLVFAVGCSGDLLGYIKDMIAQAEEYIGIDFPKTGQTTCYDSDGNVILCSGTGQDGNLQMGVAWLSPRFTDNGNGTICDKLTGLMWYQNGYRAGADRKWAQALSDCNGLSLGGHSNWRLLNVNELESLINIGEVDPIAWLNQQGFSNVQADYYWSSTTSAPNIASAWSVDMPYGYVDYGSKTDNDGYVLAVRSGQ